jgi:Fungal trichothecene efflux pump (TRI12)
LQIFAHKFVSAATHYIGGALALELNITNPLIIQAAIEYTAAAMLEELKTLPGIGTDEKAYAVVVAAGQIAYASAYKYVYYVSIAFGGVTIVAACFLGDIGKYMDSHVAVRM